MRFILHDDMLIRVNGPEERLLLQHSSADAQAVLSQCTGTDTVLSLHYLSLQEPALHSDLLGIVQACKRATSQVRGAWTLGAQRAAGDRVGAG